MVRISKKTRKNLCLLLIIKAKDNNILAVYRNFRISYGWTLFDINNEIIDKDRSIMITEHFLGFENQDIEIFDVEIFIIKLGKIGSNNNISI